MVHASATPCMGDRRWDFESSWRELYLHLLKMRCINHVSYALCCVLLCYLVLPSDRQQVWGCYWFKMCVEKIEEAIKLKQRLVVFYFLDEVGEGCVEWEDTASHYLL